jgi:oxygen-dependent protoporphyrinogen oxidase
MAADLVLPRRKTNGLSDESLSSFVRRRLGREALERMAQPMVGGIYTADPEVLSLRATLPRFLDMEREHRSLILAMLRKTRRESGTSGARYSLFLSFDRGMEVLVRVLGRCEVRLNTRVVAIERERGFKLKTDKEEPLYADAIVLAVPAYVAARLISNLNPSLAAQLDRINYASTATINLAYRREAVRHPLDGFGFVVPFVEKRSLIACSFSSVKFPGRAPENHVLLRAFVGGALHPDIFSLEASEMLGRVETDLRELLGITERPLFAEVSKWEKSMPQYEVGHLDRVAAIESELAQLPNLQLAGNAYRGAGIPDCIRSGETAAEKLINSIADVS